LTCLPCLLRRRLKTSLLEQTSLLLLQKEKNLNRVFFSFLSDTKAHGIVLTCGPLAKMVVSVDDYRTKFHPSDASFHILLIFFYDFWPVQNINFHTTMRYRQIYSALSWQYTVTLICLSCVKNTFCHMHLSGYLFFLCVQVFIIFYIVFLPSLFKILVMCVWFSIVIWVQAKGCFGIGNLCFWNINPHRWYLGIFTFLVHEEKAIKLN